MPTATDPITLTRELENRFSVQEQQKVGLDAVKAMGEPNKDPYTYDTLPSSIQAATKRIKYYIHSISPRRQIVHNGSYGTFNLMECPESKSSVVVVKIPELVIDWINRGDYKKSYNATEGLDRAKAILTPGKVGETTDMTRWGFFYSENEVPSIEELASAKAKLLRTLSDLVKRADILYRSEKTRSQITPVYLMAAAQLKVVRPWFQDIAEQKYCPACLTPVHIAAAVCPNGDVLDWAKAFQYGRVTKSQYDFACKQNWAEPLASTELPKE